MNYIKSNKYNKIEYNEKIMGPNPLKLCEELMVGCKIPENAVVMDLGSGQGVTSVFLAKEYGFKVYAADLWSDPEENMKFFKSVGLDNDRIIPVKADATDLPFANNFFDGVVCTDSYNYFGRDKKYLDEKLLPFVKQGGYIYITIPGMNYDMHGNYPSELLLSWTDEQLGYIRDMQYWKDIVSASKNSEIIEISVMESNDEVWNDWIKCDNDYAKGDRAAIEAGGLKYMNFIKIVLRKK